MRDGGIYILHTPAEGDTNKTEFRVMHLYDIKEIWGKNPDGKTINYDEVLGKALLRIFGKTKAYTDKMHADECAHKLFYRLGLSDPSLIRDGINSVYLCEPFSFYIKSVPVAPTKKERKPRKPAAKRTRKNEKGKK